MAGSILVENISKRFRRHAVSEPTTLKDLFVRGFRPAAGDEYFWALREVSLEVRPGQVVGVIGRNGSGKSTLLRMIGGIGLPDTGRVVRKGRIGSMLDLGLGFHPDLTGEENVNVAGIIYGLTRREIRARMGEIAAFAELERFMGSPFRTYSSGMRLRLAFAVAVHCEPEVLLIDEVLAVGDHAFQNKCLARISEFQAHGCAIVIVSHDINQVRRIADHMIWIDAGRVVEAGRPATVSDHYYAAEERRIELDIQGIDGTADRASAAAGATHTKEVEITRVRWLDLRGEPAVGLRRGDGVSIDIHYRCHRRVPRPLFMVSITRADGQKCCEFTSRGAGLDTDGIPETGILRVRLPRVDLCAGNHFVDIGVFEKEWAFAYDYQWHAISFDVESASGTEGAYDPEVAWSVEAAPVAAG